MSSGLNAPVSQRLSKFTAAEALTAACSFEAMPLTEARPVRYHRSRDDHHGLTWRIGTCDCDRCPLRNPDRPSRYVLILPMTPTGELHALSHVHESSFTPCDRHLRNRADTAPAGMGCHRDPDDRAHCRAKRLVLLTHQLQKRSDQPHDPTEGK